MEEHAPGSISIPRSPVGSTPDATRVFTLLLSHIPEIQYLRPASMEREHCPTPWADAVCIDQASSDERFDQVMLMSRVYRNTNSLLIWLAGGDSEEQNRLPDREGLDLRARRATFRYLCTALMRREWLYLDGSLLQEAAVPDKILQDSQSQIDTLIRKFLALQNDLRFEVLTDDRGQCVRTIDVVKDNDTCERPHMHAVRTKMDTGIFPSEEHIDFPA